jgi:hypothetical protein
MGARQKRWALGLGRFYVCLSANLIFAPIFALGSKICLKKLPPVMSVLMKFISCTCMSNFKHLHEFRVLVKLHDCTYAPKCRTSNTFRTSCMCTYICRTLNTFRTSCICTYVELHIHFELHECVPMLNFKYIHDELRENIKLNAVELYAVELEP